MLLGNYWDFRLVWGCSRNLNASSSTVAGFDWKTNWGEKQASWTVSIDCVLCSTAATQTFSFNPRLLSLLGTTTAMLVLVLNALKKLPLLFVGQLFWLNYPLYLYDEAIGGTRLASPTPCHARWEQLAGPGLGHDAVACFGSSDLLSLRRSLAAVDLSWCVWSQPPVVQGLCLPLSPRSCWWWLVSMTVTPQPGAALPRLATLVSFRFFRVVA